MIDLDRALLQVFLVGLCCGSVLTTITIFLCLHRHDQVK